MLLHNVSETALWVAAYRAIETERADALFEDPYAGRLAGDRGRALVAGIPQAASIAWSMSVRTVVIDELVLDRIARGTATVVNLGAGLDMRAFRLQLPPSLTWLDVDLPGIIGHRREALRNVSARCHHRHVEADLAGVDGLAEVMATLGDTAGPILVLTEGLLIYLEPPAVRALARRLLADARVRWWVTDLVAPCMTASVKPQWTPHFEEAACDFRFTPDDSRAFFAEAGWREEAFRSTLEEAMRLGRPPPAAALWNATALAWWLTPASKRRRLSGIALLGRGDVDEAAEAVIRPTAAAA